VLPAIREPERNGKEQAYQERADQDLPRRHRAPHENMRRVASGLQDPKTGVCSEQIVVGKGASHERDGEAKEEGVEENQIAPEALDVLERTIGAKRVSKRPKDAGASMGRECALRGFGLRARVVVQTAQNLCKRASLELARSRGLDSAGQESVPAASRACQTLVP